MAPTEYDFDTLSTETADDDDLVRTLRAAVKAANKTIKEREKVIQTFVGEKRGDTIQSVLKAKGYDPGVAADIPGDVEPTEDAVMAWLGSRPWIKPSGEAASTADVPPVLPNLPGVPAEILAQIVAAQNLSQQAQPVTTPLGDAKLLEGAQKALGEGHGAFVKYMKENGLMG